jgi:Bacterial PH domain
MTSPSPSPTPQQPKFADRAFRSPMGIAGGCMTLALGLWLVLDAGLRGSGRTPLMSLAFLLLGAPLVVAFTLRPVVYVGDHRMLVRNPFRTITVPWARVEAVHSRYSTEIVADGTKYQLWAVPVSMRARKRAYRQTARAAAPAAPGGLLGRGRGRDMSDPFGPGRPARPARPESDGPVLAPSDQAVEDLRDMARRNAEHPESQAPVAVRWAYEVIAPAVAGAIAVLVVTLV